MEVHYISPSILPSLSANSVHVVMQTRALADIGASVTLYACRAVSASAELPEAIRRQYGVSTDGIRLITSLVGSGRGINLRIAMRAVRALVFGGWPDLIISRNLYASYLLGVLARRPLVFEIHDVETGIRGRLQLAIMQRPWIRIVTISEKLLEFLFKKHGIIPVASQVLHDAAPAEIMPIPSDRRRVLLGELVSEAQGNWHGVCGYFGHLYAGRGIEIIESMAEHRPNVLFLVAGGRDEDVAFRRSRNTAANLMFLGHLPHNRALQLAKCVDVLLMPYQINVSIGIAGRDTAQWMSPMKMFEYMAAGVPLISSDLPVLREVLQDGENALLVSPGDPDAWIAAMDRLLRDTDFARRIADKAYAQYLAHHTWERRAHALIGTV